MNRFASIALCLSFSTTAVAGDREAVTSIRGDSDTGATSAHAGIWPPLLPFPFPFPGPSTGPYDPTPTDPFAMDVEFIESADGFRGAKEYAFAVNGEEYTVEVRDNSRSTRLALYDEDGHMVVGYMTSARGAAIFDGEGLVERGERGDINISTIQEYGPTAALLTNPVFLQSFLAANGEDFAGDDDPPAYWWIPAAALIGRCVEASFTYNSDGTWSASIGWDC